MNNKKIDLEEYYKKLKIKLEEYRQQKRELENNYHAISGAVQAIEALIKDIEQE